MKTLYRFLTISLLFIAGCQSGQNKSDDAPSLKNIDDADFKRDFKDLVMCHCVMQGIGDKKITNQIELLDKTFYNPIEFIFKDRINQIVAPVISRIKRDSVNSLTTVSEGAQGKRVFSTCLRFYESQTLDSATRVALNVWKHTNVDSAMAGTAYWDSEKYVCVVKTTVRWYLQPEVTDTLQPPAWWTSITNKISNLHNDKWKEVGDNTIGVGKNYLNPLRHAEFISASNSLSNEFFKESGRTCPVGCRNKFGMNCV